MKAPKRFKLIGNFHKYKLNILPRLNRSLYFDIFLTSWKLVLHKTRHVKTSSSIVYFLKEVILRRTCYVHSTCEQNIHGISPCTMVMPLFLAFKLSLMAGCCTSVAWKPRRTGKLETPICSSGRSLALNINFFIHVTGHWQEYTTPVRRLSKRITSEAAKALASLLRPTRQSQWFQWFQWLQYF